MSSFAISGTSPTKRRTKAEMTDLRAAIYGVLEEILAGATDRGTFYQLVSRGVVPKEEAAYKGTVCRLLAYIMRRDSTIPFSWITDQTRWMRKPRTYHSLSDMLEQQQNFYRRALWDDQDAYVEIWLEKKTRSRVCFYEVTERFDVPLMVSRGYASLSFPPAFGGGNNLGAGESPLSSTILATMMSPAWISAASLKNLFANSLQMLISTSERVAVTLQQIEEMKLPVRPSKTKGKRGMNVGDWSVEVDAINPVKLRAIAESCINRHVDQDLLHRTKLIEEQERQSLEGIYERMGGAPMNAAVPNFLSAWGVDLTEDDLRNLAKRFITPEGAAEGGIRRVDSITGAEMFARKGKNMAGLIIPNVLPGENGVREYRLRLDVPDFEYRADGSVRETNKYVQPTGRKPLLYFPPGVSPELLQDVSIPVIITEGEFKALGVWRLARHETASPRFLAHCRLPAYGTTAAR